MALPDLFHDPSRRLKVPLGVNLGHPWIAVPQDDLGGFNPEPLTDKRRPAVAELVGYRGTLGKRQQYLPVFLAPQGRLSCGVELNYSAPIS